MFLNKPIILSSVLVFPVFMLWADTIILKSGEQIRNAKAIITKEDVTIIKENGSKTHVPKSQIKKIAPKEESWFTKKGKDDSTSKLQKENNELQQKNADLQDEIDGIKKENANLKKAKPTKQVERKVPWGNIWRSAVFPGWGQYRNKNKIRAGISSTLFLAFLYGSYSYQKQYKEDKQAQLNQITLWSFGGNTLVNLGDTEKIGYVLGMNNSLTNHAKSTNNSASKVSLMYIGTLLVWFASVFDAAVSEPAQAQKTSKTAWKFDLFFTPLTMGNFSNTYEPRVNINYQWQF
ncbi:MAG: hypothetical protein H7A23_02290 [Leptospiraceae bacterium]|nr:hypothetical protein [Leptospiraceae bacterium]MCP5493360.1 hypothetical protein [Leptospiraceae bacterium]